MKNQKSTRVGSEGQQTSDRVNARLADVLPSTHEVLTDMPNSPAYHFNCLWSPDGKRWSAIDLIHPMNDLDISFVKRGLVAFPKNIC